MEIQYVYLKKRLLVLTVGYEILIHIMTRELSRDLKYLVAGDARLETFNLHLLSVSSSSHNPCKKGPASPHVQDSSGVLSPLSKLLLPHGVQSSTCLFGALI